MGTARPLTEEEEDFLKDLINKILDSETRTKISIRAEAKKINRSRDWLTKRLEEYFQSTKNETVFEELLIANRKIGNRKDVLVSKEERSFILDLASKYVSGEKKMAEVLAELNNIQSLGGNITRKSALRILKQVVEEEKDEELGEAFQKKIVESSRSKSKLEATEFQSLSTEARKEIIIDRFMRIQERKDVYQYSREKIEEKYEKFKEFVLARNDKIDDSNPGRRENYEFTERDVQNMLYGHEGVLKNDVTARLSVNMELLDNFPGIGTNRANQILKRSTIPIRGSDSRLEMQLRIANANNLIPLFVQNPHLFVLSPRTMYALIEYQKDKIMANNTISKREDTLPYIKSMTRGALFPAEEALPDTYENLRKRYKLEESEFSDLPIMKRYLAQEATEREEELE